MAEIMSSDSPYVGRVVSTPLRCALVWLFIAAMTAMLLAPLNPVAPRSGLDASWVFAMNQAVSQHLKIGHDLIFTFGPFAAIYTGAYSPATDQLILTAGLFLGLSYATLFIYSARTQKSKLYLTVIFLLFCAAFLDLKDTLLLSYPLFLVTVVSRFDHARTWRFSSLTFLLVLAPLGLLPLVKGTLLLLCSFTMMTMIIFFLYHRQYALAFSAVLGPVVSTILFWVASGQEIQALPGYFKNMLPIIAGYTEAMSASGDIIEILVYCASSLFLVAAIALDKEARLPEKILLLISYSAFLLLSFKAGFVRHDGHEKIAAMALVFAAFIYALSYLKTRSILLLLVAVTAWGYICKNYFEFSVTRTTASIYKTFDNAITGLALRQSENGLTLAFEKGLAAIRDEYSIPPLAGTTDIYSYDQAYLLASDNTWNPRPVFQSYSAYTPELSALNARHLRGASAPDNVLFRIQPIDGRLPSLEDSLSWPALFDNYTPVKLDGEMAYFHKNRTLHESSSLHPFGGATKKFSDKVQLPHSIFPVFAKVDVKPTALGKLWSIFFKPPQLQMSLTLMDGTVHHYRVVSNMMRAGFFISPLVKSTQDLTFMAIDSERYLSQNIVDYFTIQPSYGGTLLWNSTYAVSLETYMPKAKHDVPPGVFDSFIESFPKELASIERGSCEGSLDELNGASPYVAGGKKVSGVLNVYGWTSPSAKNGLVADKVFITLTDKNHQTKFADTRKMRRPDVEAHFRQRALIDSGYKAIIDTTRLSGEYTLGVARMFGGKLQQCAEFNIPIKIERTDKNAK